MKIRKIKTGAYISSSPVWFEHEGRLLLAWGGDGLHVTTPEGEYLPGFPCRGKRFFASSPAVGDVNGDGIPEIFCGNDDDALYGFRMDGSSLNGFPFQTGGDVYSTPALFDLYGDGKRKIIFGSDDGAVYVLDEKARVCPGWPQKTGHFVSASPTMADVDGDGKNEVIIGSWDQGIRIWKSNGKMLPGWPAEVAHIIWACAAAADLDGDGFNEIIIASDQLYAFRSDGSRVPGYPVPLKSWTVSTPCISDSGEEGRLQIGVGADKFYVFEADGSIAPGFPVDLEGYIWASPIAADIDDCGKTEWIVGSWRGDVFVIKHDGQILHEYTIHTQGPIYSSPAIVQRRNMAFLACGSWDKFMYVAEMPVNKKIKIVKPMFQGDQYRNGHIQILKGKTFEARQAGDKQAFPTPQIDSWKMTPDPPLPEKIIYIDCSIKHPESLQKAMLIYEVDGMTHPSPLTLHRNKLRGMIHPLRKNKQCRWRIELEAKNGTKQRIPPEDPFSFSI